MNYAVNVTPSAKRDLAEVCTWIGRDSPFQAARWYDGITRAILSLGESPRRCPRAVESEDLPVEVRSLRFKSHRILFTIGADAVYVLRVRHAARRPITTSELDFENG